MGLLLATVRGGLLLRVFGPLPTPFRPIDDEVGPLPVLPLTLRRVPRLAFRQYP
jgi:hypothetical protein